MTPAEEVIRSLLIVSEKAAHVARTFRQNDCLLALLIQEKGDREKNPRYTNDFKTLADVLIQEVIRYVLENKVTFRLHS